MNSGAKALVAKGYGCSVLTFLSFFHHNKAITSRLFPPERAHLSPRGWVTWGSCRHGSPKWLWRFWECSEVFWQESSWQLKFALQWIPFRLAVSLAPLSESFVSKPIEPWAAGKTVTRTTSWLSSSSSPSAFVGSIYIPFVWLFLFN